jgi:hypothetical protein
LPWKYPNYSLQKIDILGMPHGIQKVLLSESWSLNKGDHCWFSSNTRKKSCGKRRQQQQQQQWQQQQQQQQQQQWQ